MKIKNNQIWLILILAIAVGLRFYKLGQVSPSSDWDEVGNYLSSHQYKMKEI